MILDCSSQLPTYVVIEMTGLMAAEADVTAPTTAKDGRFPSSSCRQLNDRQAEQLTSQLHPPGPYDDQNPHSDASIGSEGHSIKASSSGTR